VTSDTALHRPSPKKRYPLFPKELAIAKVVAPINYKRDIIKAIENDGFVQPINVDPRLGADHIEVETRRNTFETYKNDLTNYVNSLDQKKIVKNKVDVPHSENDLLDFVKTVLDTQGKNLSELLEKKRETSQNLSDNRGLKSVLEKYNALGLDPKLLTDSSSKFTKIFGGTIYPKLKEDLNWRVREITDDNSVVLTELVTEEELMVLVIALESDAEAVFTVLKELNFQPVEFPKTSSLSVQDIEKTISNYETELEQLEKKLISFAKDEGFIFQTAIEVCNIELKRVEVELMMKRTKTQCILWAWIPPERIEILREHILKATENSATFDTRQGEFDPELVPSYTPNAEFYKPVRSLVSSFGTPSATEIDPFPFVKYLFPILFGIMFADVGHGAILFLIGVYIRYKKSKMDYVPDKGLISYLYGGANLFIMMGAWAFFLGFAFGSIFGDETLLWNVPILVQIFGNTTWQFFYQFEVTQKTIDGQTVDVIELSRNYTNFLVFSFAIGAIVITFGLFLDIYQKKLHAHNETEKQAALLLAGVYLFVLIAIILGIWVPILLTIFLVLSGISALTLLVIEYKAHKLDGMMLAFDHILSLLSNTFSFGRLLAMNTIHFVFSFLPYLAINDGFGRPVISHYFEIGGEGAVTVGELEVGRALWTDIVDPTWWIIGAIIGSLIVVPIETVLSSLQSLRLNWVEFFGKFFKGHGKPFEPIVIKREFSVEALA
jgi:V/A-type H+/Na+-transporting ATPase subunit I